MQKLAYVILGKAGDIFSVLPIVQTQENANVVVSKQYASVIEGIDGINPIVYDGEWTDLTGAIKWAKSRFKKVIPLQVYGDKFPIRHSVPSFQHEQYMRAGMVDKWDTLSLTLPRNLSIDTSKISNRPFILLADESQSSPIAFKKELLSALVDRYGANYNIVRASELKMDNIKDLLPVFDAASLIISIDTAHMHLSAASKTPVIAIATDTPQLWHGTAWSKRFTYYCRYGQFAERQEELLRAADCVLNGSERIEIVPIKTRYEHGYNMGLKLHDGRRLMPYRYHPEKGKWRTEFVMQEGDTTLPIVVPEKFKDHSIEDPKLFTLSGRLYLSYVVATYPSNPAKCVMAYGELKEQVDCWKIETQIIPKYSTNDFTGTQKNWSFFESDSKLYAIYGSKDHQTVLQINGSNVVIQYSTDSPKWNYGEIRGGVVMPYGDKFIRFFHSLTGDRMSPYKFQYHVGALIMDRIPPFKVLKVGSRPIISGHEGWMPNCSHFKPNVVFPCGAIKENGNYIISVGVNDCQCATVRVKESQLNL